MIMRTFVILISLVLISGVEAKPMNEHQTVSYLVGENLGMQLKSVKHLDLAALKQALDQSLAGKPPTLDFRKAFAAYRQKPDDKTGKDFSTAAGMVFAQEVKKLRKDGIRIDTAFLIKAMQDVQKNGKGNLTLDQRDAAIAMIKKAAGRKIEKIKETGEAFLAKNKKKAGIKTTKTGLQYRVVKKGKGDGPKASDWVTVHYRGTLINGDEFDSSYKRKQPATFRLNQVIKGWTEGLQLMKPGGKNVFYIPSDLGYGDRGGGAKIPGGSVLIFEVELIRVN